jgi:ketosteroid isomerase-like protein
MTARRIFLVSLLAVAAASGAASFAAEVDKALVDRLTAQADAWDKAIVRKDRNAIADNMADDFRQIDASGGIEDKESFLLDVLSPKLRIDPYTVEDFDVRIYGDVALLSGRTRMTGAWDGKPFNTQYRYIDVYVRKNGVWKVASVQITSVRD